MALDFATSYADNPWEALTTNQRPWYDPLLRKVYRKLSLFSQFTTFKMNLSAQNTTDMTITSLFDTHANFNQIATREIWMPSSHVDSRSLKITFGHYGGKVSMHEFDDLITYWKANEKGGVKAIINGVLGRHLVDVQDMLSRNAILSSPFKMFSNGRSNFGGLVAGDTMNTDMLESIHLGMGYRDVPYAQSATGEVDTIVCVTTPGVYFDLQHQSTSKDWLGILQYADPKRLLRYEVGTFKNVRFIVTPKATLYNTGVITVQGLITVPVTAGDGAPSTAVDQVYTVGQPGATHYVTLDTVTGFNVGDIVSIHKSRTNLNGVTNGVDYLDGSLENRRITVIDTVNKRLSFDVPILEDFKVDLDSGSATTYGYVTKGTHVHASMFIAGPDGIVQGVGVAPRLHFPRPVDDFESMYRASWDSRQGFNVYNPAVLETVYSTGAFRQVGNQIAG